MITYAILTVPGHGHVNPTLALAQELVARGERVIYYLNEEFCPAVEATGADFRLYESKAWKRHQPGLTTALAGKPDLTNCVGLMATLAIECIREIPQLMEQMAADRIECVLYDRTFMPGAITSQALHLLAVQLNPSFVVNERMFKQVAQHITENERPAAQWWAALNEKLTHECEIYKLPCFSFQELLARVENLNIVFLPRAFQPAGETFDERYVFVGPSLTARGYDNSDFPLEQPEKRPLLYVSLGTAFNDWLDFYHMCFDAFARSEWQVVLSFGTRIDPAALKEPPANFLIAPYVPQLEVLSRADLFISHGGMNSIMESLSFGVPLVVILQVMEQEMNARHVQELGLGLMLEKETLSIEKLCAAVSQVADDASFRARVQEMQQGIRRTGGYRRAADEILRYMQGV
jgi:MGT family glycosyltransferase